MAENEAPIDLFEKVDFDAWNEPDWALFRELHGDDVLSPCSARRPRESTHTSPHVRPTSPLCPSPRFWNIPSGWLPGTGPA